MPPIVYIVLAAFLAGLAGGWKVTTWRWDASLKDAAGARYSAVVRVRDTDKDLQRLATVAGGRTEAQLQFQREKANAINQAVATRLASLPACVLPGDVVGLLNDATRSPAGPQGAGSTGEPGQAQPATDAARPAAADSTCAAELTIAARNYVDVCIPNAIERDALRDLYNQAKARINAPP